MAKKYKAFISYAHADRRWAEWLHKSLETYRPPKALVGRDGKWGRVAGRLSPIFRDRDELSASGSLGPELQRALADSEFLIVICSPASAQSRWVNEEISYFRSVHGAERVLAIIVEGDPAAAGEAGCFPPALLAPAEEGGAPVEPIAADARAGSDGKRAALLKIAAGMLGVGYNDLVRRDAARRQKRMAAIAGASTAGMAFALALAAYANFQRLEADAQRIRAQEESDTANAALDYLVNLFQIANPATENPRTITAITILERGEENIETELGGQPRLRGRLMGAIGEVYVNLGQYDDAIAALERVAGDEDAIMRDRIAAQIELAAAHVRKIDLDAGGAAIRRAEELIVRHGGLLENVELLHARLEETRAAIAIEELDWARAVEHLEAARAHFEAAAGDNRFEIGRIHTNAGLNLVRMSRFDDARSRLNQALRIFEDLYGRFHIRTATALHNIAYAEFTQSQSAANDGDAVLSERLVEEASIHMQEAMEVYEQVLDADHPTLATGWLLLGRIQRAAGAPDAAAAAFERSNESLTRRLGASHIRIGYGHVYRALALADAGRFDEAFAALEAARVIYDLNSEPGSVDRGDWLVHFAIVMEKAGRAGEATDACADGLEMIERGMDASSSYVREMQAACARVAAAATD